MSRKYLLDASALLALIHNEPGANQVLDVIDDCQIHAINLAEVLRKLVNTGKPSDEVIAYVDALNIEVIEELGIKQIHEIAKLAPQAKLLGLSLGDCVCLMAASWFGMTAVTADRRWSDGFLNVLILQIR